MSAKLIYSLTDNENPDLQKQIGCMNGFFHLFDRHRRIAGHGRLNNGQPQKRLPPPPGQNGKQAAEANSRLEKATGKDSKKAAKEKRRNSTESSRPSFSSSSCSSSFSSMDFNKTANPEPSPSSQNSSSETPSRDFPFNQPNISTQFTRKPVDLRDVIKDSMHREARGLSVKTGVKEQSVVHTLKYIDSPRPLEPPKSAKPKNDSFRVFSKFRDSEEKDGRTVWAPRDLRRLSYDDREAQDCLKTTVKLKELPRLSLDSRQGCIRSSIAEAKPSYLLSDLRIVKRNGCEMASLLQEPGSSKRASSVVAKLMGLVDPMPIAEGSLRLDNALETEKDDPLSRSSRAIKVSKHDHFSGSPRNSHRDVGSPRLRNGDSAMRASANQKFPIETAPWRQQQGNRNRGSQAPAFKCQEAPAKIATTPLTVYGEIEKRLADLEFKKSGKDLRALKQILEAMQKSERTADDKKVEKLAYGANGLDYGSNLGSQRNLQSYSSISPTAKGSIASMSNKSPIVIMKPAKLMGTSADSASVISSIGSVEKRTTKHLTARNTQATSSFNRQHYSHEKSPNMRTPKSAQSSKVLHDSEENSASSGRISGTTSPRLQQRRLALDKQSDTSGRRRHSGRQLPAECNSPGRKCKPRSSNAQRANEQSSEGNANSLQSESNVSLASDDIDSEVTSIIQRDQIASIYFEQSSRNQKNPNGKMAEAGRATSEQPSPISVLDANFYRDDSPSPVKKTSNAFKDDETPYPDQEVEWDLMDLDQQSNGRKSSLITEVDQNPQETLILPTIAEAFVCDNTNRDHIYISDILMASDLPRKLESGWMSVPLHSSHQLINPKLFLALEQHNSTEKDEKIHRKLVFDVVNEILVRKLVVTDSFTQWLSPDKLTKREAKGQQVFRELCSEVDRIRGKNSGDGGGEDDEDSFRSMICDDLTKWPMNWEEYGREIPAVVLDVERLIFKDLVTEIVSGEAVGLHGGLSGHCRKLF